MKKEIYVGDQENSDIIVIITHNIDPYYRYIPSIIFYPTGFKYKFRYDKRWIRDSQILAPENKIKKVWIILRDIESGKLFPLRSGHIESSTEFGKFCFFDIRLGSLLDSKRPLISSVENQVLDGIDNSPKRHLEHCLLVVSNLSSSVGDEIYECENSKRIECWTKLVDDISSLSKLNSFGFLYLVDLLNSKGKALGSLMGFNNEGYKLVVESEYVLELLYYFPKSEPKSFILNIGCDSEILKPWPQMRRVDGRYDRIRFYLSTSNILEDKKAEIQIISEDKSVSYLPLQMSFSIQKTKRFIWGIILALFSFILFSVFVNLDELYLKIIGYLLLLFSVWSFFGFRFVAAIKFLRTRLGQ